MENHPVGRKALFNCEAGSAHTAARLRGFLLSTSFRGGRPVRFGMNSDLRMSSSPFR